MRGRPVALAVAGMAALWWPAPGARAQPAADARGLATGRIESHEITSRSLHGNLLGDDPTKRVLVYLPPRYDASAGAKRYPVLYLLHGIFDEPEVWTEHFGVPGILDRLIAEGVIPPLIVAMPQGGNRLGGGFYRNSPVSGRWADFIAEELVAFLDSTYSTRAEREARAVAGHSMGGYGALHLAMTRPDVFGIAYAMSPCCLAAEEDLGQANEAWVDAAELERPEEVDRAIEARDFYLVASLGVLTAFLPDPSNPPFHVRFPFRRERGETVPVEPVYTEFLDAFPIRRIDEHREALLSLEGLGLDYGIGEQFAHIPEASRAFSRRLAELRIPHILEVYDGDHRERVSERLREVVLPWVARRLPTAR